MKRGLKILIIILVIFAVVAVTILLVNHFTTKKVSNELTGNSISYDNTDAIATMDVVIVRVYDTYLGVVEKDDTNEAFTTKGDNNDNIDSSPVSYQRLIGKAVLCIPMLGYIADFIQSSAGMVAGVSAIVLVFVLWFLADYLKKKEGTATK